MRKVLYLLHMHPEVRTGGAQVFALELFGAIQAHGKFEPFLLAAMPPEQGPSNSGTPFLRINSDPNQLLITGGIFDGFLQSQKQVFLVTQNFRDLLLALRPDVVHFQHTVNLGVEFIREVRNTLPEAQIVYTLHEFMPICFENGQMIRTGDRSLCSEATPRRCHECFPDISPGSFKMRELFIKAHFALVDLFVSPSHFVLERYVKWGLPREKMFFLENGRVLQPRAPVRGLKPNEKRRNFGYFGTINLYKGTLVLLKAMEILASKGVADAHLYLHGAHLEWQSAEYQHAFQEQVERCKGSVTVMKSYDSQSLPALMEAVDWVVVPSIWWENAPLVIQEAFMHGRPVICGNAGGMAEKVKDDQTGLHFRVNDPEDLAAKLLLAMETPGLWEQLQTNIEPVFSVEQAAEAHVGLYETLLKHAPERGGSRHSKYANTPVSEALRDE